MSSPMRIPCVLMRGGTSRGPFFLASDLPRDPCQRDEILLRVMGSGNDLQIDGIGGGNPLTSKVAIVGPSTTENVDIDYLFAQVKVRERVVDTSPNCGNMLAGVGPFAIEAGLIKAKQGSTTVRIRNVNTNKIIEARISTPGGRVTYSGDTVIDGVPGTAAPILLSFVDAAGSKTGKLLPTSHASEIVRGIEVSCIDAATPLVLIRASDLGKTGHERPEELDRDFSFMARLEAIRIEAGERMGFRNVADMVIPKPVLIAPPIGQAAISARYFMPHACHKALAITGAVGIATASVTPGTLAEAIVPPGHMPRTLAIEHPSGRLEVHLEVAPGSSAPVASIVRTARRLFEGSVIVDMPAEEAMTAPVKAFA